MAKTNNNFYTPRKPEYTPINNRPTSKASNPEAKLSFDKNNDTSLNKLSSFRKTISPDTKMISTLTKSNFSPKSESKIFENKTSINFYRKNNNLEEE